MYTCGSGLHFALSLTMLGIVVVSHLWILLTFRFDRYLAGVAYQMQE